MIYKCNEAGDYPVCDRCLWKSGINMSLLYTGGTFHCICIAKVVKIVKFHQPAEEEQKRLLPNDLYEIDI